MCDLDRERTALCLKSIFSEFVSSVRSGKVCELQLGFGKIFCSPETGIRFVVKNTNSEPQAELQTEPNVTDKLPKG